ncbi:MAG TPA: hypothetical protein VFV07_00130, partial [Rhizomicrobium sp.]|nr:hypothetical protein [Rhizomicrobium sp.]
MLRNENYERLRQKFVDQFEPDGQGFLYRKFMRDAPIPVSAAERNRYIATFDKARKYQIWGTLAGTLALIISLTAYDVTTGTKPPDA